MAHGIRLTRRRPRVKIIRSYIFFVVALLLGHVLFVWLVDARKDFATGVIRPLVMDSRSEKTLLYTKAAAESPVTGDRKSTRLNSSHGKLSRMPSSA